MRRENRGMMQYSPLLRLYCPAQIVTTLLCHINPFLRALQEIDVWIFDTFDNNFKIEKDFTKELYDFFLISQKLLYFQL